MPPILLLDDEVAERLGCSRGVVQRLRLTGRLTYLPGRPPLVDEADLIAYLEAEKCRAVARAEAKAKAAEPPDENMVRLQARRKWLMRALIEKVKQST